MSDTQTQTPICEECVHIRHRWHKMTYYPSVCAATFARHPVSGKLMWRDLCKDKNKDGDCKDFEPRSQLGCLVFAALFVVAVIAGISYLIFGR